ncbi:MAG: glycosyltransferase family 1 protein [Treponema sp.]|jgi:glycosyltransferase involved in cell wall biosynthesis|nr:glycosyltransferase family 1 protein [Treponema sp.]
MRIALVHYHLRRGGVTSVVHHQAKALLEGGDDVLIITGEGAPEDSRIPHAVVEALGYDAQDRHNSPPGEPSPTGDVFSQKKKPAQDLADALCAVMEARWGQAADILHVHNPMIKKNTLLIPALNILNKRGLRLLLQNHDVAEDFRPDVYEDQDDYPENCHYAVINTRDYSYLHRAGLKKEGLHLIPNEVIPVPAVSGLPRTRYLYPVRAIRRKNIGEALFLALFIPPGRTIAVTLPPVSPWDKKIYQHWKDLAEELKLPVEFEIGAHKPLAEVLGSAFCVITTSIKEGFGFSYLEPWTAGRAVIGRRIDYVCRDFEAAGIRFDSFYPSLNIPTAYISSSVFRKKMENALTTVYRAFGLDIPGYILKQMNDEIFSRETLDFGRFDEEFQEYLLRALVSNDTVRRDVAEVNPFLVNFAEWRPDEELIQENRIKIDQMYGRERISGLLRAAYQGVTDNPVVHKLSKSVLLELYLDPLKFSLVGFGHG